jgi:hypothetical protein
VTHKDDYYGLNVGTLIDERFGDFRVLWEDGEETIEPSEALDEVD